MDRKGCPLLIQSDTEPSLTVSGRSYTRTYMLECVGGKCAAYKRENGFCKRFNQPLILEVEEGGRIDQPNTPINQAAVDEIVQLMEKHGITVPDLVDYFAEEAKVNEQAN